MDKGGNGSAGTPRRAALRDVPFSMRSGSIGSLRSRSMLG